MIEFAIKSNYWLEITLNRPEKANALNSDMFIKLTESISDNYNGIIFRANGKHFCAGADLVEMQSLKGKSRAEIEQYTGIIQGFYDALSKKDCPIISRTVGCTAGAGIGICACSDFVFAEEQATFSCPEVKSGIVPAIIAPFLIKKIGYGSAKAMFISGLKYDLNFAEAVGLVDYGQFEVIYEAISSIDPSNIKQVKSMLANKNFGARGLAQVLVNS